MCWYQQPAGLQSSLLNICFWPPESSWWIFKTVFPGQQLTKIDKISYTNYKIYIFSFSPMFYGFSDLYYSQARYIFLWNLLTKCNGKLFSIIFLLPSLSSNDLVLHSDWKYLSSQSKKVFSLFLLKVTILKIHQGRAHSIFHRLSTRPSTPPYLNSSFQRSKWTLS